MSYEKVKLYFDKLGLGERIIIRDSIGDTVEHAAKAIGCEPACIAKTMSFIQNNTPILIVMSGDAKVSNSKYRNYFQEKAKMIPWDSVEEFVGHIPGAVCPFAINEGVKVYLDISLKRFDIVHTAGGSVNSTIGLSIRELEKYSKYESWIDVCNGWNE